MAQENGRLDPSGLKALSVGGRLTPGAADAFEQLRTAGSRAGVTVTITSAADAYRLYEIQERIFTDRYQTAYAEYAPGKVDRRLWQGRPWFRRKGTAAAAVPGTSNHGWALAVDIANVGGFNSTFYGWLTDNAPLFGFSNTEGASVGEAWHWVYSPTLHASHGGGSANPGTTTPTTPPEEDDDMFTDADRGALKVIFDKMDEFERRLNDIGTAAELGRRAAEEAKTNTGPVTRGGVPVSLRQEIADTKTTVQGLVAAIWDYKPTGVSAMWQMIAGVKQRVVDGHPGTKPFPEVESLRKTLEEGK